MAPIVGPTILDKAGVLADFPALGRPDYARPEYRQVVLRILNAPYVFQYRYDGGRVVILRVFHGRESRTQMGRED